MQKDDSFFLMGFIPSMDELLFIAPATVGEDIILPYSGASH